MMKQMQGWLLSLLITQVWIGSAWPMKLEESKLWGLVGKQFDNPYTLDCSSDAAGKEVVCGFCSELKITFSSGAGGSPVSIKGECIDCPKNLTVAPHTVSFAQGLSQELKPYDFNFFKTCDAFLTQGTIYRSESYQANLTCNETVELLCYNCAKVTIDWTKADPNLKLRTVCADCEPGHYSTNITEWSQETSWDNSISTPNIGKQHSLDKEACKPFSNQSIGLNTDFKRTVNQGKLIRACSDGPLFKCGDCTEYQMEYISDPKLISTKSTHRCIKCATNPDPQPRTLNTTYKTLGLPAAKIDFSFECMDNRTKPKPVEPVKKIPEKKASIIWDAESLLLTITLLTVFFNI